MPILKQHSTKESSKAGMAPGTLIGISETEPAKTIVNCIEFDDSSLQEYSIVDIKNLKKIENDGKIRWIEIKGLLDIDKIENLGQAFNIHPLTLEDSLNTYLRPKFENFDNYFFISLKYVFFKEEITSKQISIIVAENVIITISESEVPGFENIKQRIKDNKNKITKSGKDYLMYMIIDMIVDSYFLAFESIGDKIEDIEDNVLKNPDSEIMDQIYSLKRQMIYLRKITWPMRDMISGIRRSDSEMISQTTQIYLNDVSDHIIQIIDTVETYRDMISELREIYLSSISNKMNEVMKVLTIIATIFIPLTFIAGIYGMNFHFMPELGWALGYPATIIFMIAISLVMILFFRKKRWI
ncbi:magnesium/cobalt transporter CorA [Methanomicrobium antiquum]|uniref:Magnesium transport protein CorA n=1 Tax=Methanomicrobium antiquum TaxID=487686 RepID=A0AAF0FSI2_9EURY|nr:magnesium/cobalt transporter CorA [Methanomicrobium antiquum]WFN37694.1 magnesium/cobalt transporter CorA [Methanomicrobium antiquum]